MSNDGGDNGFSLDDLDLGDIIGPNAAEAATAVEEIVVTQQARISEPVKTIAGIRTGRQPFYFDLETIPDESRLAQFGLPPLPLPKQREAFGDCPPCADVVSGSIDDVKKMLREKNPDNAWLSELGKFEQGGKKRKGVFDAIDECRSQDDAIIAATEERRKLLSITPEFNKIVALGWAVGDGEIHGDVLGQPVRPDLTPKATLTEADLLDEFWSLASKCSQVIGGNIIHFDLPTIFIRSAILGVKPTRRFAMEPWKGEVVDVMRARFPKQTPAGFTMKRLATLYGIKILAEGVDGSQVEALFRSDPQKLSQYVGSDVHLAREIHKFYRGTFV